MWQFSILAVLTFLSICAELGFAHTSDHIFEATVCFVCVFVIENQYADAFKMWLLV